MRVERAGRDNRRRIPSSSQREQTSAPFGAAFFIRLIEDLTGAAPVGPKKPNHVRITQNHRSFLC